LLYFLPISSFFPFICGGYPCHRWLDFSFLSFLTGFQTFGLYSIYNFSISNNLSIDVDGSDLLLFPDYSFFLHATYWIGGG
jgi:hypothetical protein